MKINSRKIDHDLGDLLSRGQRDEGDSLCLEKANDKISVSHFQEHKVRGGSLGIHLISCPRVDLSRTK